MLDAFKKTNKILTQNSVSELEQELGELKDGEEKDKAGRSLEKLAYWMDKGMQFYSAIDAPNEIKDVFPVQQEVSYLSDDLIFAAASTSLPKLDNTVVAAAPAIKKVNHVDPTSTEPYLMLASFEFKYGH